MDGRVNAVNGVKKIRKSDSTDGDKRSVEIFRCGNIRLVDASSLRSRIKASMRWLSLSVGFLVLSASSPVDDAGDIEDASIVRAQIWLKHIRRVYRPIFSVKAELIQDIRLNGDTAFGSAVHGELEIRRKGRLRFSYNTPENTQFISNGDTAWLYLKARRLAYKIPIMPTDWTKIADVFFGNASPEDFVVALIAGNAAPMETGDAVLKITPINPDRFIQAVVLTVQTTPPCIKRILVETTGRHIIRLTLRNVKYNVGIGSKRFEFSPPKRVRIIAQ